MARPGAPTPMVTVNRRPRSFWPCRECFGPFLVCSFSCHKPLKARLIPPPMRLLFLLMARVVTAAQQTCPAGQYATHALQMSGSCASVPATKAECEAAAAALGLSDLVADTISSSSYPPGCVQGGSYLNWNTLPSSSGKCGERRSTSSVISRKCGMIAATLSISTVAWRLSTSGPR